MKPPPQMSKVCSLEELSLHCDRMRAEGKSVVLAHGAFDLLHLGHLKHLESAHEQGDVLVVTVTADAFVNKGPGRPHFSHDQRAEMLAALAIVDRVAINFAPTAENVIQAVKPTVYVKGPDYREAKLDVTGKIVDESRMVEAHGGRVHFTDDITFSSSALLNRHFSTDPPERRAFLEAARERGLGKIVMEMLERIRSFRVLLVGDTIVDEYFYVAPLGKSSKENLVATLLRGTDRFAGGIIAAANHVADFCDHVEIVTSLGTANSSEDLIRAALKPNVKLNVVYREGMPTTRKTRYVDNDYMKKLFEVYVMDDTPMNGRVEEQCLSVLNDRISEFDVVIATDFGHGMVTPRISDLLQDRSRFLAVNTQSNAANYGYNLVTKYRRADYVCIDAPEARLAIGNKFADLEEIAGRLLPSRIDCRKMILTHGRFGCVTFDRKDGVRRIPAFSTQALDTMGAGDAVLAITSPLVASGAELEAVGFVGNAVGAIKIGILGHSSSVEKVPLLKYVTTLLK